MRAPCCSATCNISELSDETQIESNPLKKKRKEKRRGDERVYTHTAERDESLDKVIHAAAAMTEVAVFLCKIKKKKKKKKKRRKRVLKL